MPASSMRLDRAFRACQKVEFLMFRKLSKVGHLAIDIHAGNDHFWISAFDIEPNRVEKLYLSSF